MVFSLDTIKESKQRSFPIKSNIDINMDKSFFFETLNMILEESKTFQSCFLETYSSNIVSEGFGSDLLKSMVGKIDIRKILINILNSFMDLLEKLANDFCALLLSLFNKDKVIKHYKKDIEKIDFSVYYQEDRYNYTNLGLNTSYTSLKNELEKEFSSLILNLSKLSKIRDNEELFREIENIKNEIDMTEDYYDDMRGYIIGSRNPVTKSEFAGELFKYFRFGGYTVCAGNISANKIKEICSDYFNYNKAIKTVHKDKSDMKSYARKLQHDIESVKLEDYVKENFPEEAQKMFIGILQNKTIRVKNTCDLFLQLFSAKLDAIKESYITNRKILFEVCKAIVKEG